MDKNKIIIFALIVIIIALLIGVVAVMPNMNKKDTNLTFMTNDTINQGDNIEVKLTDANGTALTNQTVNITITDKDKTSEYQSVVTNDLGIGVLKIDKSAGDYYITVNYGGDDNYNACNATLKITIKEKVVEAQITSSSSTGSSDWYDSKGVHHFYKNGQEYVGDPNAQHMTIEQSRYIDEHGMR